MGYIYRNSIFFFFVFGFFLESFSDEFFFDDFEWLFLVCGLGEVRGDFFISLLLLLFIRWRFFVGDLYWISALFFFVVMGIFFKRRLWFKEFSDYDIGSILFTGEFVFVIFFIFIMWLGLKVDDLVVFILFGLKLWWFIFENINV